MKAEQLYTQCLAEAAYYIESNGEAVIIDPLRETQPYIDLAAKDGAKIKYILETHFHADFVSGHIDLAKKTGASIVFGPNAKPGYDAHIAADGEILEVGKLKIKVLHTPGHTMESTTYLLLDENGKEHSIYTGDTLFIGDVGRPDLAVKSDLTQEDLAGHLFDSLRNKIMSLPDDVIVYPGHGAGSACGKNMSSETFDTLGNQKKLNYALRADMTKEDFIKEVTDGLVTPPQYFPKNVALNKMGYDSFDEVLNRGLQAYDVDTFEEKIQEGILVIDTRHQNDFVKGFIPGTMFIGIDGSFATWVGTLVVDLKQPILFISDEGREEEVVMRFSRVGYDNVIGYLKGGFKAWKNAGKAIDTLDQVNAEEFSDIYKNSDVEILDVRKASEFDSEHIFSAKNLPLDNIFSTFVNVDKHKKYFVHCAGGYRSVIASSILKNKGFDQLVDIAGGFKSLSETEIPKTEYQCPKTML